MSKTQHKANKPHSLELQQLRENEESVVQAKTALLEQNHLFHLTEEKEELPRAENENSSVNESSSTQNEDVQDEEMDEPVREILREGKDGSAEIIGGLVDTMIHLQENFIAMVNTQRSVTEMWMDSWFNMLGVVSNPVALTVKEEDLPAQRAASLIMG